jgi:hypothetical protein
VINGYKYELPQYGVSLEVDRLRRDRGELIAELCVRCSLPGAKTVNGVLSTADFNLSSLRARSDRAKLLRERSCTNGQMDWYLALETLCQKVFEAERAGAPAVDLRTMPRPERGDEIRIEGLAFPRRHPSILFGDGGAAKSYTALYIAGQLSFSGMKIGFFDWELAGEDHRDRLERLFGTNMPQIFYARCERPLINEADRLRRIVLDYKLDYAIYDSIAFAVKGRPEDAEVAGEYFRAVREIRVGSLHIAHINKSDDNDKKPFGSIFWHNGARATWFVHAAERVNNATALELGFFQRKSNLGGFHPAVSFNVEFHDERTMFLRANVEDSPDLAVKLSIRQRMALLLKRGAMTTSEIASELDADKDSVERTARRYKEHFILLSGGKVGLLAVSDKVSGHGGQSVRYGN